MIPVGKNANYITKYYFGQFLLFKFYKFVAQKKYIIYILQILSAI